MTDVVKRPQHIASHLGYLLRRARIRAGHCAESGGTPDDAGCHLRDLAILVLLRDDGPLSQQQLSERLVVNRSVMVRLVDSLEASGDVVRTRRPDDRRSYAVDITTSGERRAEELASRSNEAAASFSAFLTRSERNRLVVLLRELVEANLGFPVPGELGASPIFLVVTCQRLLVALGDARLEPLGLDVRRYVALAVCDDGRASQSGLADHMMIGPAATVDLVDELEAIEAVRRVRDAADRRSYWLETTDEGKRILDEARPVIAAASTEFTAAMRSGGEAELLSILSKLTHGLALEGER